MMLWCSGYHYCTASFNKVCELRFCACSNPTRGVSDICDGNILWQWSRLEIRRKHLSSINHCAKIINYHHRHYLDCHHQWTDRKQAGIFSIFQHVLSRLSNVMNIINFAFRKLYLVKTNNLVIAAWDHTFLQDITWNLLLLLKTDLHLYVYAYWISVLHCPECVHPNGHSFFRSKIQIFTVVLKRGFVFFLQRFFFMTRADCFA